MITNKCGSPSEVATAIAELPTKLEDVYKLCLRRNHGKVLVCRPRLLMFVCAAPEPMHLDTLRQLMAINLETGDFLDDEMVSGESLLTSGVGLLAVNPADQLVAPVHDSIRTYMF